MKVILIFGWVADTKNVIESCFYIFWLVMEVHTFNVSEGEEKREGEKREFLVCEFFFWWYWGDNGSHTLSKHSAGEAKPLLTFLVFLISFFKQIWEQASLCQLPGWPWSPVQPRLELLVLLPGCWVAGMPSQCTLVAFTVLLSYWG